jgi:hypothetical protein
LDSRDPSLWRLHLWRSDKHWVRTLEGGIEQDAAVVEAAALIAARAVMALLEEPTDPDLEQWESAPEPTQAATEEASVVTKPADTPPKAPPPAPSERTRRWALSAAAAGSLYAPERGIQASAAVGIEHRTDSGWVAAAEAEAATPVHYSGPLGSFDLARTTGRLTVGRRAAGTSWSTQLGLGAVLENTRRVNTSPSVGVAATEDGSQWRAGIAPSVSVAHTLGEHAELGGRLTGDWFFSSPRFTSAAPDGEALVTPYTFRPRLDLYLALLF